MALQRRKLLAQALNLGHGTDTIPADSGGSLVGDKIGIHTFLQQTVNVMDFGATGNGTTDDTAAIQAAIDALPSSGGTVLFPPASSAYSITAITIDKPVALIGNGYGGFSNTALTSFNSPTVIKATSTTDDAITVNLPSGSVLSGFLIQGFRLHGLSTATTGSGIVLAGGASGTTAMRNWSIRDVFVENFKEYGIRIQGNTFEGEMQNVQSMTNGIDGMIIETSSGGVPAILRMFYNNFEYNTRYGLYSNGGGASILDFGGYYAANGQHGVYHTGNGNYYGTYFEGNGTASSTTYNGIYVASGTASLTGGVSAGHSIQKYGVQVASGATASITDMYWDSNATADIRIDAGATGYIHTQLIVPTVSDASSAAQRYDLFDASAGQWIIPNGKVLGWSDAAFSRVSAASVGTNSSVDFFAQQAMQIAGQTNFYTAGALTLANGANNDVVLSANTYIRISGPTGAFSLTGLTGGTAGRLVILFNSTSQQMTITNLASSGASNQIATLTGSDIVLRSGTSAVGLMYDGTLSTWIVLWTN